MRALSALPLLLLFLCVPVVGASAQGSSVVAPPASPLLIPPAQWAAATAAAEIDTIKSQRRASLRYTVNKSTSKGTVTREVIDTPGGTVARLIRTNGQLLTASEDEAERNRLQAILDSPEQYAKREKRDTAVEEYAIGLVRLMPKAMVFTYAPASVNTDAEARNSVVIDFHPDPAFHPPNMLSELLTGVEGRLWIDTRSRHLVHAHGHLLHTVNIGWGMLARIYAGGTVDLTQKNIDGSWISTELTEHLRIREMLIRTETVDVHIRAENFRTLQPPLTVPDAVRTLLAMQVPLR